MRKNVYKLPVMELRSFGVEDVICASGEPQPDPHFVKGNGAVTAGSKTYVEAAVAFSE